MIAGKAKAVFEALQTNKVMMVSAESCTGGMIAAAMTDIAGSSKVFERGFVTYTNQSKHDMLGVPLDLIETHGAVSEEVVIAMATGALRQSNAQISVSVTGIAGPGGATKDKPVGLVHIASARAKNGEGGDVLHLRFEFEGDRAHVREQSVEAAFEMILKQLDQVL